MTPENAGRRSNDRMAFQLGQNDQAIRLMLLSQTRMELDISSIKAALAENKGERRIAIYAAGGAGSILMFILTIIGKKLGLLS